MNAVIILAVCRIDVGKFFEKKKERKNFFFKCTEWSMTRWMRIHCEQKHLTGRTGLPAIYLP